MLVVVAAASFIGFLQVVVHAAARARRSYAVWAVFDDVLGLQKKSPVQIAGIDIGRIKDISLVGAKRR